MNWRRRGVPWFEAPGTQCPQALWYTAAGPPDAPPLLMLHGFLGTHVTWQPLVRGLRQTHRVVRPDLYGHGRSGIPSDGGHLDPDGLARDLLALMAAVAAGSFSLVGYSMGGRIALRMAAAAPAHVARLVLVSASAGIPDAAERDARRRADAALAAQIEASGLDAFLARWDQTPVLASGRPLTEAQRRRLAHDRARHRPEGIAASLRHTGAGSQVDSGPLLPAWSVPTLLVAGRRDGKYVASMRQMAAMIPGAQLAIVESVGHRVPLEAPVALAGLVSRFLTGLRVPTVPGPPGHSAG